MPYVWILLLRNASRHREMGLMEGQHAKPVAPLGIPGASNPLPGWSRLRPEQASSPDERKKTPIRSGRRRLLSMKTHCSAANQLLEELDAELAASAAAAGTTLAFSAAERQLISLAADALDRRAQLAAVYDKTDDIKEQVKLSREIRLQDMCVQRLISKVSTAAPRRETLTSVKARNAVNTRWQRERDRNAGTP